MAIPDARLNDKKHATRFRAFGGLVISAEPGYCVIGDIPAVDLSPVIRFDLDPRRICEDVDATWDLSNSWSPCHNLAKYEIDWGDGNVTAGAWGGGPSGTYGAAANEWDLAGAASLDFTIRIFVWDDEGLCTTITEQIEVIDCAVFPFMGYAGCDAPDGAYTATTWQAINTGLDGGWLHVEDIVVNPSVVVGGVEEVWIGTRAGLGYSHDGGQTWHRLALNDPPNSWGDAPAPTATTVYYTQIIIDPNDPQKFYVAVNWQNGAGNWRAWLLRTTDRWATHTWYPLGSNSQTALTWGYIDDWESFQCVRYSGSATPSLVNPQNILGNTDMNFGGGQMTVPTGSDLVFSQYLLLDLGTWIELRNTTVDGGINIETRVNAWTDTVTWSAHATDPSVEIYANELRPCGVSGQWCGHSNLGGALFSWTTGAGTYPPAVGLHNGAVSVYSGGYRPFRWIRVHLDGTVPTIGGTVLHEYDFFRFYPHAVHSQVRILSIDVDREYGRWFHCALWEGSALRLRIYDTWDTMTCPWSIVRLGWGVTTAELALKTRWLKVISPKMVAPGYGRKFIVYGRFVLDTADDNIAIFDSVPTELCNCTLDYTIVDDGGWGLHWIGALVREPTDDDLIYAVVNFGAGANLWLTRDGGANWTNQGAMTFGSEAMALNPDYLNEILVGNRAAVGADQRANYTMDEGANWFDVSTGLPAGADLNVVRLLSERV